MSKEPVQRVEKISNEYFGYLVGQVREVLEASISDKVQLHALSGVMCDRLYVWWENADGHRKDEPNRNYIDNENTPEELFADTLRGLYTEAKIEIPKLFDPVIEVPRLVKAIRK